MRLFLNLKTGRYRLEGSTREGTLTGVSLTDARLVWQNPEKSQGYIAFYGDGSSSGGKLALVEPTGRRYLLEVKPITGKVSLRSEANRAMAQTIFTEPASGSGASGSPGAGI